MRGTRAVRSSIVGAVVVAGLLAGFSPASAAHATAAGVASAGSARVVRDGQNVPVAPVGPCSLTGAQRGSSQGASKDGIVSFGSATSSCGADPTTHTSTSMVSGSEFTLSALVAYGGPKITIATYQVKCVANQSGTDVSWQYTGLTGVAVPAPLPSNYLVPVKSSTGALLADVTFAEVILPSPNDGSITVHMMHIKLFPNGVPKGTTAMSGDIYVGSTACSPTA
jgi:hypothetical protein